VTDTITNDRTHTPTTSPHGDGPIAHPPTAGPASHPPADVTRDLGERVAGVGAVGFAALVVVQNVVRGSAPLPGDEMSEVVSYFGDHRATMVALLLTFVASLCCLVSFLGGVARRLLHSQRRGFATLGLVGAATVIAMFSGVVASEQALSVVARTSDPDRGAASALWALHNSIFTVNLLFIGLALVGLSRAGIAAGVTPRWFGPLAPIGAALLAGGTVAGPFIAAGDAPGVFAVSVIGFMTWLLFLVSTGVRLICGVALSGVAK